MSAFQVGDELNSTSRSLKNICVNLSFFFPFVFCFNSSKRQMSGLVRSRNSSGPPRRHVNLDAPNLLPGSSYLPYLPCFVQKTPRSFLRRNLIYRRETHWQPLSSPSEQNHIWNISYWKKMVEQTNKVNRLFLPCLDRERGCLLYIATLQLLK